MENILKIQNHMESYYYFFNSSFSTAPPALTMMTEIWLHICTTYQSETFEFGFG